jgi:hypothetical protein
MPRKAASLWKSSVRPVIEQLEAREMLNATPDQLVTRLYGDLLDRQPDRGGLSFWADQIGAGRSASAVASDVLNSSESLGKLVDDRFQAILGRHADPAALGFFGQQLQNTGSIIALDAAIYGSAEFSFR